LFLATAWDASPLIIRQVTNSLSTDRGLRQPRTACGLAGGPDTSRALPLPILIGSARPLLPHLCARIHKEGALAHAHASRTQRPRRKFFHLDSRRA
jgi:hypothetical protein